MALTREMARRSGMSRWERISRRSSSQSCSNIAACCRTIIAAIRLCIHKKIGKRAIRIKYADAVLAAAARE